MFFILKNVFCCLYFPYIKKVRSFLEDFRVLAAKVSRKFFSTSVDSAHPSVLQFRLKGKLIDLSAFKITFVYRHILMRIRNLDLGSENSASQRWLGTVVLVLSEFPDKTRLCTNHFPVEEETSLCCYRKETVAATDLPEWPDRTELSEYWIEGFCFVGECSCHFCFGKQIVWLNWLVYLKFILKMTGLTDL